jgi:hypothetical protein
MDSPQPRPLPSLDLLIDAYESAITGLESITVDDAKTEVTHRLVIVTGAKINVEKMQVSRFLFINCCAPKPI